jgi:BirA family biotin operon repressor/biotin-[acetyl-CoA-carboxylase] ligase
MISFKVLDFDTLPSTQDELRRRVLAAEDVHGLVVRAACQTQARGQRARDWSSGRGGSYQTLAVRDPVLSDAGARSIVQPGAALVLALGLAQVLPRYGVQVGLKWPNDLLYRGKKLAGLLVEAVQGHLLIGVGMNVNNDPPEGATGLRGWDVEGVNMVVLEGLQQGLAHLCDPAFNLSDAYAPFDLLLGQPLELLVGETVQSGRGAGVDARGRLRVRQSHGVAAYASARLVRYGLHPVRRTL